MDKSVDELIRERDALFEKAQTLQEEIKRRCQYGPSRPVTECEGRVLYFLQLRERNKEIAKRIGISERTVKFHVSNILRKYNVKRREALYT